MKKNKSAQDMVRRRNKKYGSEWLKNNAKKAGLASAAKRKLSVVK